MAQFDPTYLNNAYSFELTSLNSYEQTGSGQLSIDTAHYVDGGKSLKLAAASADNYLSVRKHADTGLASDIAAYSVFCSFYLYIGAAPSSNILSIVTFRRSTTVVGMLTLNSNKKLCFYDSRNWLWSSASSLGLDTWYRITLYVRDNPGTSSDSAGVYVNNSSFITFDNNPDFGGGYFNGVGLGNQQSTATDGTYWIDNFVLASGNIDVSTMQDWCTNTDLRVRLLVPVANGSYTAWTGTFADADEVAADDSATVCYTSTNGAAETFGLTDWTSIYPYPSYQILGMIAVVRGCGNSVSSAWSLRARSNSVNSDTTASANSGWGNYNANRRKVLPFDFGRNNIYWSAAAANTVEVGAVSAASTRVDMTQAHMEVVLCGGSQGRTIYPSLLTAASSTNLGSVSTEDRRRIGSVLGAK